MAALATSRAPRRATQPSGQPAAGPQRDRRRSQRQRAAAAAPATPSSTRRKGGTSAALTAAGHQLASRAEPGQQHEAEHREQDLARRCSALKSTATEAAPRAGAAIRCCSSRARTTSPPICAAGRVVLIDSPIQRSASISRERRPVGARQQATPSGGNRSTIVAARAARIARKPQPIRGKTPSSSARSARATSQARTAIPSSRPKRRRARLNPVSRVMGRGVRSRRGSLAGYRRRRPGRRSRRGVCGSCRAAIISRVTAAVDSRSSQNATGMSRKASTLRANWRTDWVRGAVAAGQRQRQADHQPADAVPVDQREQRRRVVAKPAPPDRLERAGDDQPRVAEREARSSWCRHRGPAAGCRPAPPRAIPGDR